MIYQALRNIGSIQHLRNSRLSLLSLAVGERRAPRGAQPAALHAEDAEAAAQRAPPRHGQPLLRLRSQVMQRAAAGGAVSQGRSRTRLCPDCATSTTPTPSAANSSIAPKSCSVPQQEVLCPKANLMPVYGPIV